MPPTIIEVTSPCRRRMTEPGGKSASSEAGTGFSPFDRSLKVLRTCRTSARRTGDSMIQAASRLRRFFSAAVFSWPHAASMSRPRGVRTGAEIPAANTMLLNDLICSSVEHS